MLSGPFVILAHIFSSMIRAEGQATKAMMGMMLGNLINIILDPIFILAFKWDIAGAAVATVIGNVFGAGYYIPYLLRGRSMLSINPRDFSAREKIMSGVLAIGTPHALGSILMSVSIVIMNGMMAGFGDLAIAAVGVAMKTTMITGMLAIGMGQGVGPLLGYCIGSKNRVRYKAILKFSLLFAGTFCFVLCGACFIFAEQIVGAFLTEPDAFEYGVKFTRILQSTAIFFGIFYCFNNALQAMGAVMPSFAVNISRQGLIYIPALFLLRHFLGIMGLVWTQPIADALSLTLAVALHTVIFRRMAAKMG
jgi:putative MATE family efflux protein